MTQRLLCIALDNWADFNGDYHFANGVSPMELHVSDLTDTIYYWCVRNMDEKERSRFDNDITIPPANIAPSEDDPMWSAEAEMALFRKGSR